MTILKVFQLYLSILLPCEWWGRIFLNHSNIEAVPNKRQPGDSPRTTKQTRCKMAHKESTVTFVKGIIVLPIFSINIFTLKWHAKITILSRVFTMLTLILDFNNIVLKVLPPSWSVTIHVCALPQATWSILVVSGVNRGNWTGTGSIR